jgi:glycosyltransferase involved in cell wall biosynthesis
MYPSKLQSIIELPRRLWGPKEAFSLRNIENREEYNIVRPSISKQKGTSIMLRAKNEEANIERCIRSIANAVEEIVFIDNGSTDKTYEIVSRLSKEFDNIKLFSYPFDIAKCGSEHDQTDASSIHSLSYYYNWCLAQCSYAYVLKWDADMVLAQASVNSFKSELSKLKFYWPVLCCIEVQTVYLNKKDVYLSNDEINLEYRIFPNRSDSFFIKGDSFEKLEAVKYKVNNIRFSSVKIFELKDVNSDEFSHWTNTGFKTERKKREYERFNMVKNGDTKQYFERVDEDIFN